MRSGILKSEIRLYFVLSSFSTKAQNTKNIFWIQNRLTICSAVPPSGRDDHCTSSIKFRIRKIPRPDVFKRFAGSVGSATLAGSNPSPWSFISISSAWPTQLTVTSIDFVSSCLLACTIALVTASRTAMSMPKAASSPTPQLCKKFATAAAASATASMWLGKTSRVVWSVTKGAVTFAGNRF